MSAQQLRIGDAEAATAPPDPPTAEQAEAIATRDRDVFLEAGAGTGKTGVLVRRYCDVVTEDGVGVDGILAITFTEKAAGELRGRIRAELARRAQAAGGRETERGRELWRLARDTERAWIGTIHGFCRRLLAAHPVAAGLDPRFRVLDEAEADLIAERAFADALEELARDGDPEAEALAAGFLLRRLRDLIVTTHEQLRSQGVERPSLPEMPDPALGAEPDGNGSDGLTPAEAAAAREAYRCLRALLEAFCRHYERLKSERSGLDFEDLQLQAVRLLRERPAVADAYRERFTHLMVDEFQDTNRLQLELIQELRRGPADGDQARVFTVGDEFQSIYGFRHADLEVFRAERQRATQGDDSRVRVLPLRGNFRSHPEVLAAVNALGEALLDDFAPLSARVAPGEASSHGGPRAELLLTQEGGWDEEGIDLHRLAGEQTSPSRVAEARFLAARLRELADADVPRGEMVVLLRAFTHVATYEEALERAGLAPYVVGGRGYWSHQQVEDMLRLLACVANPLDDESLFGALASPACQVSPDALWLLRRAASDPEGRPRHVWPTLARRFGDDRAEGTEPELEWAARIGAEDVERLRGFHSTLVALRAQAPLLSLEALVDRTAREFGYDLAVLMRDRGRQRLANVRKLMRLARRFEAVEGRDLRGFLRYAEARTARDEREGQAATEAEEHDGVRIMTIHAAKGLEFGTVAVADLGRPLLGGGRQPDLRLGELAPVPDEPSQQQNGGAAVPALGLKLARTGQRPLTLWDFDRLKDAAAEADSAEACRLIYVAASRAQDRLLLSGTFSSRDLNGDDVRPSHSALRRLLPAFGFEGEEEPVAPGEARIAVRVNRPSPEAAGELVRRLASPARAAGVRGSEPPPLLPPASDAPAVGHLSYRALSDFDRCGYRFYAERVLGLRPAGGTGLAPDPGEAEADDVAAEPSDELAGEADLARDGERGRELRLGFGNAVHALLEWSARNRWARPGAERCAAALAYEGLPGTPEEAGRVTELIQGWLDSPLRRSLEAAGARVRPEAPFLLAVAGSVVRGKMDLLAELPGGEAVVVDYKTDALGDASPAEHAERYATQRNLYALAASLGAHPGTSPRRSLVRTVYCFLERPDEPVEHVFEPSDLELAGGEIERLVEAVSSGRFEVTDQPHLALCHDCPARERLCTHPLERTMAPLGP